MRLVVEARAWDDLNQIGIWIAKDNRPAARRIVRQILETAAQLPQFPGLARRGRVHGTYERVVAVRPTLSSSRPGANRRR